MTVVNACILDDQFSVLQARDSLTTSDERSHGVIQLAAIAGICNEATFDAAGKNEPAELRKVNGDATDSAILRFAEILRPVQESKDQWHEVYGTSFSSKTKHSKCQRITTKSTFGGLTMVDTSGQVAETSSVGQTTC